MRTLALVAAAVFISSFSGVPAHADDTREPDPNGMWECPIENGPTLYTNREQTGCRKMELKPLSSVPSMSESPARAPRLHNGTPSTGHELLPHGEGAPPAHSRAVPDWGKDWYAANSSDASVQSEVCSLYSEWLQLIQRTRGGFYFGSDPAYGADPSGRNFTHTNGFWDNARYVTLANIFGRGFVPIGCL